MLKALRNKNTQKQIYIVIAVAVVTTFAVSGVILSRDEGKGGSNLGILNGRTIHVSEFLASYKAVDRQFSWMFGDKLKDMRKYINLKGETWDRILLLDYAKKEHITTSDKEVVEWITSQKSFQSEGRFDERVYKLYIQQAFRTDARQFEEEIRQMLTVEKVQEKVRSKVSIMDEELKKLYMETNLERDIQYGILPIDEKVEGLKTPQEAIKKLDELKKKMQNNDLEALLTTEKIEVKKSEKVKKGTMPADLASAGILDQVLSPMKEGDVSEAFPVTGGAGILKVVKVTTLDDKTFEADKEKFKEETLNKKAGEEMRTLLNKLRNELKMNLEAMKQLFPADEEKP